MPFSTVFAKPAALRLSAATLTCAASLLLSLPAEADLKLTSKMTTTGGNTPMNATSTIYYKGKKMRSETDKNVVLFDGEKKTITNINLASKTYTVTTMETLANNPALQMMDMTTTANVQPSGKTKILLGKQVKGYNFTAIVKLSMKKEMMDRINASAKAQGGTPPQMPKMPTITMKGEDWVAEKVNVPPGAIAASLSPLSVIPGIKPLLDKFTSIKGVPLESTIIIAVVGGPKGAQQNQTTTTIATSLSETSLPDSLFTVPPGYTQSAPAMPGMGRPGPAGSRPAP